MAGKGLRFLSTRATLIVYITLFFSRLSMAPKGTAQEDYALEFVSLPIHPDLNRWNPLNPECMANRSNKCYQIIAFPADHSHFFIRFTIFRSIVFMISRKNEYNLVKIRHVHQELFVLCLSVDNPWTW